MINKQLLNAYQETDYIVYADSQEYIINIQKFNPEFNNFLKKKNYYNWYFITAYNPYSRELTDRENASRNKDLEKTFIKDKLDYYPAEGRPKDKLWKSEKSFLVLDTAQEYIFYLMEKFEQNAVVSGKRNSLPELLFHQGII